VLEKRSWGWDGGAFSYVYEESNTSARGPREKFNPKKKVEEDRPLKCHSRIPRRAFPIPRKKGLLKGAKGEE